MTDEGKRYVKLSEDLKVLEGSDPRYGEVSAEMDRIWWRLSELEREEIEGLLIAIDVVERTGKGYPPSETSTPRWSDDAVEKSFRAEIRARLEAHNAAYREKEKAELEQVLREHPEKRGQPGYEVRDSFAWEAFQATQLRIDGNKVTIIMPIGFGFRPDLLHLFDHTKMAWSRPIIGAVIIDGEARPTIEIMLVATWTDEMDAKWRAEGNDRKQVVVELFEDDVRWLLEFVAARRPGLRERLELALEPIP